jgi:sigma-E factor negative regulatory protein RseC
VEKIIKHNAVVKKIDGQTVRLTIVQSSACSGCAARQMCNSAESKEKEVDVYTPDASSYRVGETVILEGRLSDGRRAALIAYGLPLLLLLPTLFLSVWLTGNETLGALWALLSVVLYYAFVALFLRKRLQRQFSFRINH